MTDGELRALVKDAVARHLGGGTRGSASTLAVPSDDVSTFRSHPSHGQYLTVINIGDDCVIEPSVKCNHCGYCLSHGF